MSTESENSIFYNVDMLLDRRLPLTLKQLGKVIMVQVIYILLAVLYFISSYLLPGVMILYHEWVSNIFLVPAPVVFGVAFTLLIIGHFIQIWFTPHTGIILWDKVCRCFLADIVLEHKKYLNTENATPYPADEKRTKYLCYELTEEDVHYSQQWVIKIPFLLAQSLLALSILLSPLLVITFCKWIQMTYLHTVTVLMIDYLLIALVYGIALWGRHENTQHSTVETLSKILFNRICRTFAPDMLRSQESHLRKEEK